MISDLVAVLENVHAMPKQGVTSSFNFGRGFGLWEMGLIALKIPYTLVAPQTWKRELLADMSKDKGSSILRAKQLFPHISEHLKLSKDEAKAEALLMAEYGRRHC